MLEYIPFFRFCEKEAIHNGTSYKTKKGFAAVRKARPLGKIGHCSRQATDGPLPSSSCLAPMHQYDYQEETV